MLHPDEREQLAILNEHEQDFYAGLMFVALLRMERASRASGTALEPERIRTLVEEVYTDLNAAMEEET